MFNRNLTFLLLLPFASPTGLFAGAPAATSVVLRAGAAHEDITPEPAVLNWVTGKPYGEVLDPLKVHTLVLDDGRQKVAIVRWDLVDVSESARDEVRRSVGAALGMPGEHIMVNASHNHSAPWTPVYSGGHRGRERDTWWALMRMPAQNDFPPYRRWMERLITATVQSAERAARSARPVTLSIARVTVADYVVNRRPRAPAWGMAPVPTPAPAPFRHPEVLLGGATFGPMDRTMTLVLFREPAGRSVASLFHAAGHAVSIYGANPGISGDWPAPAAAKIAEALGGEALFLQGCAGDINPWLRGFKAVAEMADGFARKAALAAPHAPELVPGPLFVGRTSVNLPLTPAARERVGADTVAAEIQVIACGPLAFVALPGETMTELNTIIRAGSPFPQTLVLGYSNGNGAHYVGMPGEKARGGYETGKAGAGTDECGTLLVEAAGRLLQDVYARTRR